MGDLFYDAARMPAAAVGFAQGISDVWTPDHLVPLRTKVRQRHASELRAVCAALDERFGEPSANWMGVFRAAAEMAVMEQVGRQELTAEDSALLLQLWNALLAAT